MKNNTQTANQVKTNDTPAPVNTNDTPVNYITEKDLEEAKKREETGMTYIRQAISAIEAATAITGTDKPSQLYNLITIIGQTSPVGLAAEIVRIGKKHNDEEVIQSGIGYPTGAKTGPMLLWELGLLIKKGYEADLQPNKNQLDYIRATNPNYRGLSDKELSIRTLFQVGEKAVKQVLPLQGANELNPEDIMRYYDHFNYRRTPFLNELFKLNNKEYNKMFPEGNGVDPRRLDPYAMYRVPETIQRIQMPRQ